MTCPKCNGTGWFQYDYNHSHKCDACCEHKEGWWELTPDFVGYIDGADNACCKAGCGTMRRDVHHNENKASTTRQTQRNINGYAVE
jgi:hypothetical protein